MERASVIQMNFIKQARSNCVSFSAQGLGKALTYAYTGERAQYQKLPVLSDPCCSHAWGFSKNHLRRQQRLAKAGFQSPMAGSQRVATAGRTARFAYPGKGRLHLISGMIQSRTTFNILVARMCVRMHLRSDILHF